MASGVWTGSVAVGDPSATRTVYAAVVGLAAIGVCLALLAIWLIRQTRPERELLAPLELMQSRSWRRKDPATQRRALDAVRPDGAAPIDREQRPPDLDDDFEQEIPPLAQLDDLRQGAPDGARSDDGTGPDDDEFVRGDEPTTDDEIVRGDEPTTDDEMETGDDVLQASDEG